MPGCAAIASGTLTSAESGNPGFIQLYYNTNNKQLGLSIRSGNPGEETEKGFGPSSSDEEGTIVKKTHLGAARFKDTNLVVGMRQHWDAATSSLKEESHDVCLLSPVTQTLATIEKNNTSIAICADPRKTAWVYYVKGLGDNAGLYEYRIGDQSMAAADSVGNVDLLDNTALAAYYDTKLKKRFVIYQPGAKSGFYELNIEKKDSDNIQYTNDARKGTPIAVTYGKDMAYLYYLDQDLALRRIVKKDKEWSEYSQIIEDVGTVEEDTQVTVVHQNGVNFVYYVQEGVSNGEFSLYIDPLDNIKF